MPLAPNRGPRTRIGQASTSGTRPKVKLIPDAATENLANLKRVKFLDGNENEYKANMMESLADEYK